MKVYSYYLKSAFNDGGYYHIISSKCYDTAVDFMKHETEGEYEEWKSLGYSDEDMSYFDYYDRQELEV